MGENDPLEKMHVVIPLRVSRALDRLCASGVIIESREELIRMCLEYGLVAAPRPGFWVDQFRFMEELKANNERLEKKVE